MSSLFLSHNHEDSDFAKRLGQDLLLRGVQVWIDQAEILPGDSLIEKIEAAIDEMEYLGVVLSPASVKSAWVLLEVRTALTQEINSGALKVIPIMRVDCELPVFLRDKFYVDFRDEAGYESALDQLVRSVRRDTRFSFEGVDTIVRHLSLPNRRVSLSEVVAYLRSMYDEEVIASVLMVFFGFAFWQLDHIFYSFLDVHYLRAPAFRLKDVGETNVDAYMGLAQFVGLSCGFLPLYRFLRGKTEWLVASLFVWPLIVNIVLDAWRGRGSNSSMALSAMQGVVLSVLLILGSIRRKAIADLVDSESGPPQSNKAKVVELTERLENLWLTAWVCGVAVVVGILAILISVYAGGSDAFVWQASPVERQLLAKVVIISGVILFLESAFLLFPRFYALKAMLKIVRLDG
jgi:hypothetical protein